MIGEYTEGAMGVKKRKRDAAPGEEDAIDTSKPTAVFNPTKGRKYTLSIALPGSIIANAQTHELQTLLAGQIARAVAVFCVDEVVIFDDGTTQATPDHRGNGEAPQYQQRERQENSYTGYTDPNYFLAHILSYLECPPHLRRILFAMHPDLRLAGTLPSLDMPHHLRRNEWCQYREGVTVEDGKENSGKSGAKVNKNQARTLVNTGLNQNVYVNATIPAKTRLTVKFETEEPPHANDNDPLTATAVSPSAPREETGYYWGYSVRSASSLSAVLTECPFDGGYDLTFGTSERGTPLSEIDNPNRKDGCPIPESFDHMMIVFGGVAGLEVAVRADPELQGLGVGTPERLFDFWVDLCPGQGSRTIRTEEAVWMGLGGLRRVVCGRGVC